MVSAASFFWVVPAIFLLFAAAFAAVGWHPSGTKSARWAAAGFGGAGFGSIVDTQRSHLPHFFNALATPAHWAAIYCLMMAMLVRHNRAFPRLPLLAWAIPSFALHIWFVSAGYSIPARVVLMNTTVPLLLCLAVAGLIRSAKQLIDKAFLAIVITTITTYPIRLALFFAKDQAAELNGIWTWSQYIVVFYLVIAIQGILTALLIMLATGMDIVSRHKLTSETDALTGLNNRRALERWIAEDIAGSRRHGAVLIIDLDRFKLVNDTFGHPAGDAVLQAVAYELRAKMGELADLARIGGEEFAILILEESAQAAPMLANMVREAIAAIRLPAPLDLIRMTVSVGVAARAGGTDLQTLIKRADMAVYQAKSNGRNAAVQFKDQRGLHILSKVA